jgi:hypothetical protein
MYNKIMSFREMNKAKEQQEGRWNERREQGEAEGKRRAGRRTNWEEQARNERKKLATLVNQVSN